jgi:ABC-type glycerol-3-phosphate transport system substrate-binding protein
MVAALTLAACGNGDDPDASAGASGGGGGTADCPDAPSESGDGIIVTSLWGGAEEAAFQAVLDAFTAETGIEATYEPNRTDYATVLRTRIQGGNPPDVAIIPGIGFLRSFARDGSIVALECYDIAVSDIEDDYVPGTLNAGNVDGVQYGLMAKLNSKATIWYDPTRFADMGVEPTDTWDGLVALSDEIAGSGAAPWSVAGLDGWTLTDWFEATYLKLHGPDAYDTLFSAEGDWTDGTAQ